MRDTKEKLLPPDPALDISHPHRNLHPIDAILIFKIRFIDFIILEKGPYNLPTKLIKAKLIFSELL